MELCPPILINAVLRRPSSSRDRTFPQESGTALHSSPPEKYLESEDLYTRHPRDLGSLVGTQSSEPPMTFSPYNVRFKPRVFEGYRIPGDPRIYPEPHHLFPGLEEKCNALGLTYDLRVRARNYLFNHAYQQGQRALSQLWFFSIGSEARMLFSTARDCGFQILPDHAIE